MATERVAPTGGAFGKYGIQNGDERYDTIREFRGYQYTVAPINKLDVRQARQRFERVLQTDANNPQFTPEKFDRMRERLQMLEAKERQNVMEAIGFIFCQKVAMKFSESTTINDAAFEQLLYPHHLPTYDNLIKALELKPHRPYWKQANFSDLENLSRLPLDALDYEKDGVLTFEDWYSLFWNYYMPFNNCAYLHMLTNQSTFYTKEFIDGFVEYLNERLSYIQQEHKTADAKAPIVMVGPRTGNLAGHLNATGKLPVPVIPCHERPNLNPYLLVIPPEKQDQFKPVPMQMLKQEAALSKYQPSLVICQELEPNKDTTSRIRSHGCVREYVHVGMSESYVEGNGWETWGNLKFRDPEDKRIYAPHMADGWAKVPLPHLSRWLVHKFDNDLVRGFGTATSFTKTALAPKKGVQLGWLWKRILTRY